MTKNFRTTAATAAKTLRSFEPGSLGNREGGVVWVARASMCSVLILEGFDGEMMAGGRLGEFALLESWTYLARKLPHPST